MLPPEVAGGDFDDNNPKNTFSRMEPTASKPITSFFCFLDGVDDIGRINGATVSDDTIQRRDG